MKTFLGTPAVAGIALGKAHVMKQLAPIIPQSRQTHEVEAKRFTDALEQGKHYLANLRRTAPSDVAEMITVQEELLDDPELLHQSLALIQEAVSAEAAIMHVVEQYAQHIAASSNAYLAARADDVYAIGRLIISELQGVASEPLGEGEEVILVAHNLVPTEVAKLDLAKIRGIVTEGGTPLGHLAIIAQGWGIPTVVSSRGIVDAVADGDMLIVDGDHGTIVIEPDEDSRATAHAQIIAHRQIQAVARQYRDWHGTTADGTPVAVYANIGSIADARKAIEMGAEGVGLLRTEFLATQGLPSEEAQVAMYSEIAEIIQGPITIRTFDIGGDKPVPGLNIPQELNPFLGWRGIRLGLDRPDEILLPQLRAILRAAMTGNFQIMFPMIATVEEVLQARLLIDQAIAQIEQTGKSARQVPVGIMVETPAAALTIDQFRGLIDFVSIGTNDLTQYTYAVDRTNVNVQKRAQPFGLAMMRLIAQICDAGIPVSICGQLAADEHAIPFLVGLGIRKLSVAPASIPLVKQTLMSMELGEMQQHARQTLTTHQANN